VITVPETYSTVPVTEDPIPGAIGWEYRVMYRHFDGVVRATHDQPMSLEAADRIFARALINELSIHEEHRREWWLERRPVFDWKRV
jgi:hypothetical protein